MATTDSCTVDTQVWSQRLIAKDPSLRLHLLGISGAGMGPIAKVLLEMGFQVSGSDRQLGAHTERLAAAGAMLFGAQQAENLTALDQAQRRPDVVLISSAIAGANPELQAMQAAGIPVVKRADFLPILLTNRKLIAVAGTHGKSTTTSMIVKVLREAGIDVGYIIGADLPGYGNAAAGSAAPFVLEADEYDHMFLGLHPTIAVITNVEWDHPDCYPTPESFQHAFSQFIEKVAPDGVLIACGDDPGAEQLRLERPLADKRWITYGLTTAADIFALHPTMIGDQGYSADLYWWNAPRGQLRLQAPGLHNVRNALAALAVACTCDAPFEGAIKSLGDFSGIARRFETVGEAAGVTIIDDYAHHPTEVRATLAAARSRYPARRIWAIFQPHTFSRTRTLLSEMAASFSDADQVIVTDIYAAREQDDASISAANLVDASSHAHIQHIPALAEVVAYLGESAQAGDVVITMGAGTSNQIGRALLQQLEQ